MLDILYMLANLWNWSRYERYYVQIYIGSIWRSEALLKSLLRHDAMRAFSISHVLRNEPLDDIRKWPQLLSHTKESCSGNPVVEYLDPLLKN